MIEYQLTHGDMAGTRFAISPLIETVLSLRAVQSPGRYPLHKAWLRTLSGLDIPDLDLLLSLLTPRGWSPDFLTPAPRAPIAPFADELARVAATPLEQVRGDLEMLPGMKLLQQAAQPDEVLGRVVAALKTYWEVALEPHWPRIRALLEADISHRGRVNSAEGMTAMLTGLSDRIIFEPPLIGISIKNAPARYVRADGSGLTLLPSLFVLHTAAPVDPDRPPMIIYQARGVANLWERHSSPTPYALAAVLGDIRAGLLIRLDEPVSSTELALEMGVTVSAVNQHLRALRSVGLLASTRIGRWVQYRRTPLADEMIRRVML